ncbi:type II toxin-antitoxin system death-on-curing family toxin [Leekyejoonella antrihumi]|uniref:type II toxin-antitoxin system death-on-curing family toxin n=1 Tax=Leekyejoonella antrihumi TaxID=1660198 RepID=UPI0016454763|nr:Fic family protein [Leekyejoonella antrihumi]
MLSRSPAIRPRTWRRRAESIWPSRHYTPEAGFAGEEFYTRLVDKAAVLVCHLAWNHPLPDGNKRAAWAALVLFLDLNGVAWSPDPPEVDDAEQAMLAIAAHEVDEAWAADWLSMHAHFPEHRTSQNH